MSPGAALLTLIMVCLLLDMALPRLVKSTGLSRTPGPTPGVMMATLRWHATRTTCAELHPAPPTQMSRQSRYKSNTSHRNTDPSKVDHILSTRKYHMT